MNFTDPQFRLPIEMPETMRRSRRWTGTTNTEADGVYGWYRYIQDFTGEFAEQWIADKFARAELIWDPFVGSGTTLVACQKLGVKSIGYDVSPFMVEVVKAKTDWAVPVHRLEDALERVLSRQTPGRELTDIEFLSWADYEPLMANRNDFAGDPKLHKWMAPLVVREFRQLVSAIDEQQDVQSRRFLRLAVASIIISASNMNLKPNISYRPKAIVDYPVWEHFEARCRTMLSDYQELSRMEAAPSAVEIGDARTVGPMRADGIFTSPPYPNDMEYVHQTRLELALLGHVVEKKGLTALKKKMVSSSVKLVYRENEWQKAAGLEVRAVRSAYDDIAKTLVGRDWGWNPADMIAQYFGGMRSIMRNWRMKLAPGATAAVVVGDSAFNGVKVCTDELLARCGELEGFRVDDISVFRQRWNSKHDIELRESVVLLRNTGAP